MCKTFGKKLSRLELSAHLSGTERAQIDKNGRCFCSPVKHSCFLESSIRGRQSQASQAFRLVGSIDGWGFLFLFVLSFTSMPNVYSVSELCFTGSVSKALTG